MPIEKQCTFEVLSGGVLELWFPQASATLIKEQRGTREPKGFTVLVTYSERKMAMARSLAGRRGQHSFFLP